MDKVVALIYASNKTKTSAYTYFSESDVNVAQVNKIFLIKKFEEIIIFLKFKKFILLDESF